AKKLAKGQIYYTPWCDERGKTVDDGTLWSFGDGSFRMTSAEPNLKWLEDAGMGLDAEVRDVSEDIGALAVQGPSSRAILMEGARIEAGLILAEVEYMPARKAVIDVQRYSPYELSLDWTVASEKGPFIGRKALLEEKRRGPARRTVGLVIDWRTVEQLCLNMGLPPQPPSAPW